jgi:hypothetical protein
MLADREVNATLTVVSGGVWLGSYILYRVALGKARAAVNIYNDQINTKDDSSSLLNQSTHEQNKYNRNLSLDFGATPQGIGLTLSF